LQLENDRFLAALMVDRIDTDAAAEFDAMKERNVARARELYLVNQAKYTQPEQIDVTHILFDTTKRGKDAALASAVDARAKIAAGADFGALAQEVSDDSSSAKNKGRIPGITRGKTDPDFEQAAFALKPGDVSEPVLSRFGYHIIRLDSRKPERPRTFAEAQSQIVAEMRQKYIADAREAVIGAIRSDSRIQVSQEAIDALVLKVDYPPLSTPPKAAEPAPKGAAPSPKAK
jgi:peptidyl-prolyl cis-trans isomerase C